MLDLTVQSAETAPEAARETLDSVGAAYGFVPNLFGILANAPAAVEGYAALSKIFGKSSFSPAEQQTVLLTASRVNGCTYCMAAHTGVAKMSKVPDAVIDALRDGGPITSDAKLEALRVFTLAVVEKRGWLDQADVDAFLAAGFAREQVLDVVLGVTLKTLSNYTNHVTDTPLDERFQGFAWSKQEPVAVG
ncbi:MAG: carboxymuconolactone decarboxylase family protein [Acidobacteriota bacterium]